MCFYRLNIFVYMNIRGETFICTNIHLKYLCMYIYCRCKYASIKDEFLFVALISRDESEVETSFYGHRRGTHVIGQNEIRI
jgi:hypothetical protein